MCPASLRRGLRAFSAIAFALLFPVVVLPDMADASSIVIHQIDSAAVAKNDVGISSLRRVLVYLPDGYGTTDRRYPVIYWLPGWQNWATEEYRSGLDEAIRNGVIPPVITVSIDVREGIVLLNSMDFGNWEDFLVDEVVPFIDRTYRTIPDAQGRAIMGHSTGGYGAIILPILHPNVWGAVGMNDGSVWAACSFFPWWGLPATFEGYAVAGAVEQVFIQLGVAISPNPMQKLHFDSPVANPPIPGVAEKWRGYCVMDPETIRRNLSTLKQLSAIAVVVPEASIFTNRRQNITMIQRFREAGIDVTELDMPGEHDGFRVERFIALAEVVLKGLANDRNRTRSVSPVGREATVWGALKRSL